MTINSIHSIRDVKTWVDEHRGAYDDRDLDALARTVADAAHEAGLRYGDDWAEWLAEYDLLSEADPVTLRDYANARADVVLHVVSVGYPSGEDHRYGDPDWVYPDEWDDLTGTVTDDGDWEWDGRGSPLDDRRCTLQRLTAYPDAERWAALGEE